MKQGARYPIFERGIAQPQSQPEERKALFETIALCPVAMLVTDPTQHDNPIELANGSFCSLSGFAESEIIGRNCRFMTGPATDPGTSAVLRSAIQAARPALVEILNYRRDGTPFRNGVMITPLLDDMGKPRWFLGSQVDLGEPASNEAAHRKALALQRINALSPRQREVLVLIARGLLSKQIAWNLKISEKTVHIHRAKLMQRLGVSSSAEAIRLAIEAGF